MTPWRARLAGWARQIRCRLGDHEYITDLQTAQEAAGDAPAVPATLRQRCLHCGHLTPGWAQDGPRYHVTQPGVRSRLVLHNPRLKTCPWRGLRSGPGDTACPARHGDGAEAAGVIGMV